MAHTFYDGSIPISQSILRTLRHVLQKAEASHPNPSTLLSARLHETMYPLADQLRLAVQYSENLAARLTDRDATQFGSNPTSLAEAFARIDTVLASLAEADKDVVNANADKLSPTMVGPGITVPKSGAAYAHTIVLPNVYFHLNITYGILRKEGVEIGKRDYYEGFFPSA